MPLDWNRQEIEAAVQAYFWMLGEQVAGNDFSKKRVIQRLQLGDLAARNRSAIERKLSNVSAILHEVGAPWVRGLKPLAHYQRALRDHVIAVARRRGIPIQEP
jgi:hypothetical protein